MRRWACACSSRPKRPDWLPRSGPSSSKDWGSEPAPWPGWPRAPTTCSGGASSSPPGTRNRARGVSGPAPTAPECAGVIHSDLQRGFIRAEVIHWDELIELGSWSAAKSAGRIRLEGKDYEVADGDVLEIRFNV